jgi:hypothetical protein
MRDLFLQHDGEDLVLIKVAVHARNRYGRGFSHHTRGCRWAIH